ncbi:hypothetical protein D3C79_564420 [compost metagenome]
MDAGGWRLPGQRLRAKRGRRRQLLRLVQPKSGIALAGCRLLVALIFRHHLAEGGKRHRIGLFIVQYAAVNMGDSAGNGGKTEAIDQNMVVALIPEPTPIRQADHHMAVQRLTAADAQIAGHIQLHHRLRRHQGIGRAAQIEIFRRQDRQVGVMPLYRHPVPLFKAELKGIDFGQPLRNRLQ